MSKKQLTTFTLFNRGKTFSTLIVGLFFIVSLFIVMGSTKAAITPSSIVERQAKAWQTGDVSAIVSDFAPEGVFIVKDLVFEGTAAIQKAAEDYFKEFTDTKIEIKRVIIDQSQGAIEWNWSDRNKATNQISRAEDAIIFELQEDGKIIYWREYIEKKS